jgi:hypothetical protein
MGREDEEKGVENLEEEVEPQSSSSSSSVSVNIRWVSPQSLKFDADVWLTELFALADKPVEKDKRKIRCLICEADGFSNAWSKGSHNYNGTFTPHHHAEAEHSKLPKAAS